MYSGKRVSVTIGEFVCVALCVRVRVCEHKHSDCEPCVCLIARDSKLSAGISYCQFDNRFICLDLDVPRVFVVGGTLV